MSLFKGLMEPGESEEALAIEYPTTSAGYAKSIPIIGSVIETGSTSRSKITPLSQEQFAPTCTTRLQHRNLRCNARHSRLGKVLLVKVIRRALRMDEGSRALTKEQEDTREIGKR